MVIVLKTGLAASWTSEVECVDDVEYLRVQARGTGFDGTLDIYQGESKTALMLTKTSGALTGYTGSSEYYDLRPSSFVQIVVTRSAGTIDELLLAWGRNQ